MLESKLLTQILTDYCRQKEAAEAQQETLAAFCRYAAQWLLDNNCVGVGQAATGLTLRFADGREFSLFADEPAGVADTPAVPISMTKDKTPRLTMADSTPSVPITGR